MGSLFNLGSPLLLQTGKYRASRSHLVSNGLRQPESGLFVIFHDAASKGVHDAEYVHRFSIPGLCQ